MNDDVASFFEMFKGPPGDEQRAKRAVRVKAERRMQLSPRQRKRVAHRDRQINFRCSKEFRDLAKGMKALLSTQSGQKYGFADVLEEALDLLAQSKGYDRGQNV